MALAAEGSADSGGPAHRPGGEVNIQLPDLTTDQALFLGFTGHDILLSGLVVCVLGLLFGLLPTPPSRSCRCTSRWPTSRS